MISHVYNKTFLISVSFWKFFHIKEIFCNEILLINLNSDGSVLKTTLKKSGMKFRFSQTICSL